MRGRAFWIGLLIGLLAGASVTACSKRPSLYMEPGRKDDAGAKAAPAAPASHPKDKSSNDKDESDAGANHT
jgi:hypothetical protein